MNQCLRIIFSLTLPKKFLPVLQKHAKNLGLEGTAQTIQSDGIPQIRIVVCGAKAAIDDFIDFLHQEISKEKVAGMEVEPFIKDRDYRGVFRVIE